MEEETEELVTKSGLLAITQLLNDRKENSDTLVRYSSIALGNARERLSHIPLLSMEELLPSFGRKWKVVANDLYNLTTKVEAVFSNKEYCYMPISVKSEFWQSGRDSFWLSRNLNKMVKYGFIIAIDGKYRFKSGTTKNTNSANFYSRSYICNYSYIKLFNSYVSKLTDIENSNINYIKNNKYNNIYSSSITVDSTFVTNDNTDSCKGEKKPISGLKIGKVRIAVDKYTTDDLECALYAKYSDKPFFDKIVMELNETLPLLEKIKYKFNFESTKLNHTKAKIRGTCSMVNYRKNKKATDDGQDQRTREEYLDDRLGAGWEEYDVKSSISQVNYLLNNGVWMGNDVDFYKLYSKLATMGPDYRNIIKTFFMRAYFSPSVTKMTTDIIKITKDAGKLSPTNAEEIVELCNSIYPKIREVLGKTYDSEIFYHETNIYLLVRKELLNRGIDVVQVYDGFFFKKGTIPRDIDDIFRKAAIAYYNMINGIENPIELPSNTETPDTDTLDSDDIQNLISRDIDRGTLVEMYGEATVASYEQQDIDDYDEELSGQAIL